jgi:succinoglycan biosynthesis transport protein ExoP
VITLAKVPTRIHSPRKVRIMAIAFILGILLAGGACFGLDYIDRTVKYKEEVENITKAPVLGYIPRLPKEIDEISAIKDQGSLFAEAFGKIRTNMGLSILGRSMDCCMVTSVLPQEGKTIVSLNMALSFARAGYNVLLMECDMRKPRLRKFLSDSLPENPSGDGLSSVIVGERELEDIIFSVKDIENLDVALCGHVPPNPSELLGSANFGDVLKKARKDYDMVILDTPPVMNVTDSVILAGVSIPVVFVTRVYKTDKKQLEISVEQIRNAQGKILGTVINNIEKNASKNLGYYYGGYYHDYKEGS